jgi:hypothetical protein
MTYQYQLGTNGTEAAIAVPRIGSAQEQQEAVAAAIAQREAVSVLRTEAASLSDEQLMQRLNAEFARSWELKDYEGPDKQNLIRENSLILSILQSERRTRSNMPEMQEPTHVPAYRREKSYQELRELMRKAPMPFSAYLLSTLGLISGREPPNQLNVAIATIPAIGPAIGLYLTRNGNIHQKIGGVVGGVAAASMAGYALYHAAIRVLPGRY